MNGAAHALPKYDEYVMLPVRRTNSKASMPQPDINWNTEAGALRERLAHLAKDRTKAEIARKTATSPTNVVRYLGGTRMPTEFSAALVKGLGVNPAWWLTGEGTPFLADVTAGTTAMGGNLLELVEAMNAVTRMKLGALAGKQHLKVLRELNDALDAHERLRAKLNEHSRGIFAQLLADIERCLNDYKVQPAAGLLKAAEQVGRLCDDAELHRKLLSHQASYFAFVRDLGKALPFQRKLLQRLLADNGAPDEAGLRNVVNLVLTLMTLSRLPEAQRVCEAALKLVPPSNPRWSALALLAFLRGRLMAERGELLEGLAIMTRELAAGGGPTEPSMRLWLTQHLLRAGLLRPADALQFGEDTPIKSLVLMDFACWLEDAAFLKKTCEHAAQPRFNSLGDLARPAHLGPFLLRALAHKDRRAVADFEAAHKDCVDDSKLYPEVFAAQMWRLIGDAKAALRAFEQADAKLRAAGSEQHVYVLTWAAHHRNALWLENAGKHRPAAATLESARQFFAQHVAKGFACFAKV